MKYFLSGTCLVLILFATVNGYGQRLIAHYVFNNSASDESGNHNNGVIKGGVTPVTDRRGVPCSAFYFNGSDGYIEVPNSTALQSVKKQFTVTCWFFLANDSTVKHMKWLTIVCKGKDLLESEASPQYRVQSFQSNRQSTFSINTELTEYDQYFLSHPFPYEKWTFFALSYDGQKVVSYLDGDRIWEFPYNKELVKNNDPLFIGVDFPGAVEYFHGGLDDLKIYGDALTESQVNKVYHEPPSSNTTASFQIRCPTDVNTGNDAGLCSARIYYHDPIITSECDSVTLKQISGLKSGSSFPVGYQTATFEAENSFGEKKKCSVAITISDVDPPVFSDVHDTVLFLSDTSQNGIVYSFQTPLAKDNCKLKHILQVAGPGSGDLFPLGITTVKFEACDESGNKAFAEYTVEVRSDIGLLKAKHKEIRIKDKVEVVDEISFDDCILTLVMYDDSQQDFDTVSVFFNGKEIVNRELIKLKENGTLVRSVMLNPDEENQIMVKAWNYGQIRPNTLKMEFHLGYYADDDRKLFKRKPEETRVLHSKPGLSAAIILHCKY